MDAFPSVAFASIVPLVLQVLGSSSTHRFTRRGHDSTVGLSSHFSGFEAQCSTAHVQLEALSTFLDLCPRADACSSSSHTSPAARMRSEARADAQRLHRHVRRLVGQRSSTPLDGSFVLSILHPPGRQGRQDPSMRVSSLRARNEGVASVIQGVRARAGGACLRASRKKKTASGVKAVNAWIARFAVHAKTRFELPCLSPNRRTTTTCRPGAGDLDPLLEKGQAPRNQPMLFFISCSFYRSSRQFPCFLALFVLRTLLALIHLCPTRLVPSLLIPCIFFLLRVSWLSTRFLPRFLIGPFPMRATTLSFPLYLGNGSSNRKPGHGRKGAMVQRWKRSATKAKCTGENNCGGSIICLTIAGKRDVFIHTSGWGPSRCMG